MPKRKILIIDDDRAILDALKIALEDAGYDVVIMEDGRNVLEMKKDFPDIVLLDLWMSGLDGQQICKYFKSQKKLKHIPIIMFSANGQIKEIAKKAKADDFISKPFDLEEILEKIASFVGRDATFKA